MLVRAAFEAAHRDDFADIVRLNPYPPGDDLASRETVAANVTAMWSEFMPHGSVWAAMLAAAQTDPDNLRTLFETHLPALLRGSFA